MRRAVGFGRGARARVAAGRQDRPAAAVGAKIGIRTKNGQTDRTEESLLLFFVSHFTSTATNTAPPPPQIDYQLSPRPNGGGFVFIRRRGERERRARQLTRRTSRFLSTGKFQEVKGPSTCKINRKKKTDDFFFLMSKFTIFSIIIRFLYLSVVSKLR